LRKLHIWLTAAFGLLLVATVAWGLAGLYGMR
jgi:cbb3-type cytochrome oxidase subunit 3